MKVYFFVFEILGISVVSVTKGAGFGHVYSYMSECKKSLVLLNCLPCRLSSVYFIDPPLVTESKMEPRTVYIRQTSFHLQFVSARTRFYFILPSHFKCSSNEKVNYILILFASCPCLTMLVMGNERVKLRR